MSTATECLWRWSTKHQPPRVRGALVTCMVRSPHCDKHRCYTRLVVAGATCPPSTIQSSQVPPHTPALSAWRYKGLRRCNAVRASSSVAPDRLTACMSCSSVRQTLGQPQARGALGGQVSHGLPASHKRTRSSSEGVRVCNARPRLVRQLGSQNPAGKPGSKPQQEPL